jgi:hypothetical protein
MNRGNLLSKRFNVSQLMRLLNIADALAVNGPCLAPFF